MQIIAYTKEVQDEARLFLYGMDRVVLNKIADEEGCGAVFVLAFPPY